MSFLSSQGSSPADAKIRGLLSQLLAELHEFSPGLLSKLPKENAPALAATAEQLRDYFVHIQRHLETMLWDEERLAFSYRVDGRSKEGQEISWQGQGVARWDGNLFTELELHEDPWAWQLQLGHMPAVGPQVATGIWLGEIYNLPFEIQLEQRWAKIEVIGILHSMQRRVLLTGENQGHKLHLSGREDGFQFDGRWCGEDRLEGTINDLSHPVTLHRISWRGPSLWATR